MSAFEVSTTHIDAMVSAALYTPRYTEGLRWCYEEALRDGANWQDASREVTYENAEQWGATLLAENRASVNYRYSEDEIESPYVWTQIPGPFDPVAILKAINCYEYQSCEHPGWRTSEARWFCDALREASIRALSGYDAAPWEVTSASQVRSEKQTRPRQHA